MEHTEAVSRYLRRLILTATTKAGSGHPTSSLSAVELLAVLFCEGFYRYDASNPGYPNNDRLIFSKGHAAPLLYSLYTATGNISEEELFTLRKFGSRLEGHPTPRFPYAEAATGSLGQGLSIGIGMALSAKYLDHLSYRTFVLLGDSEIAEGSVWEAMEIAAHYHLSNLIAIVDVSRLGQRGETMVGSDIAVYAERARSFGWHAIALEDGHSIIDIKHAYEEALAPREKPTVIIARTVKGKGISFLEDRGGWHGRALSEEECHRAICELIDSPPVRISLAVPDRAEFREPSPAPLSEPEPSYPTDVPLATRKVYGSTLARITPHFPNIVALDAETSNSTYAADLKTAYPDRFFEMFIAEQNMVSAALGLSLRGKKPFVSTFAAFLTRAADQIRMSRYSNGSIVFVGSHAGVSIGEDGISQMGLEDIALFRSIPDSAVLYPADAYSADRLIEQAAERHGISYIRMTRADTPVLYTAQDTFPIGGSKVLRSSGKDIVTVVAAGITLHEALAAYDTLQKEGTFIRVIDLYSVKPIDTETLRRAAHETRLLITVEDHYPEGGIGEAVMHALSSEWTPLMSFAVRALPQSGSCAELLAYEKIDRTAIVDAVHGFLMRLPS